MAHSSIARSWSCLPRPAGIPARQKKSRLNWSRTGPYNEQPRIVDVRRAANAAVVGTPLLGAPDRHQQGRRLSLRGDQNSDVEGGQTRAPDVRKNRNDDQSVDGPRAERRGGHSVLGPPSRVADASASPSTVHLGLGFAVGDSREARQVIPPPPSNSPSPARLAIPTEAELLAGGAEEGEAARQQPRLPKHRPLGCAERATLGRSNPGLFGKSPSRKDEQGVAGRRTSAIGRLQLKVAFSPARHV